MSAHVRFFKVKTQVNFYFRTPICTAKKSDLNTFFISYSVVSGKIVVYALPMDYTD